MGIIRRTFTFWLIAGVIVALAVTVIIPMWKNKSVEDIPGHDEAAKLIDRAKTAIKNLPGSLPENPLKAVEEQKIKKAEPKIPEPEFEPVPANDSIKERDARLFKRQCSILDDLM